MKRISTNIYPDGVPIGKGFGSGYKQVMDGMFKIQYTLPTFESDSTISVFCSGFIGASPRSQFDGFLEQEDIGDILYPSQELVEHINKVVKDYVANAGHGDPESDHVRNVISGLLGDITNNIPTKGIYQILKEKYPAKFGKMTLLFERKYRKPFSTGVQEVAKKQNSYKYASSIGFVKTAQEEEREWNIKDKVSLDINRDLEDSKANMAKMKILDELREKKMDYKNKPIFIITNIISPEEYEIAGLNEKGESVKLTTSPSILKDPKAAESGNKGSRADKYDKYLEIAKQRNVGLTPDQYSEFYRKYKSPSNEEAFKQVMDNVGKSMDEREAISKMIQFGVPEEDINDYRVNNVVKKWRTGEPLENTDEEKSEKENMEKDKEKSDKEKAQADKNAIYILKNQGVPIDSLTEYDPIEVAKHRKDLYKAIKLMRENKTPIPEELKWAFSEKSIVETIASKIGLDINMIKDSENNAEELMKNRDKYTQFLTIMRNIDIKKYNPIFEKADNTIRNQYIRTIFSNAGIPLEVFEDVQTALESYDKIQDLNINRAIITPEFERFKKTLETNKQILEKKNENSNQNNEQSNTDSQNQANTQSLQSSQQGGV